MVNRGHQLQPFFASCIAALGLICFPASQDSDDETPWPTNGWSHSSPQENGLDAERLQALVNGIREGSIPNIHSLLIVRNGNLLVEEYFDSHKADELHTLQSVSKSFTSALVGIAIEKGKFSGLDEKVLDFFPDMEGIDASNSRRQRMTVEDLLTMRSGTDYHERGADSPHFQLNRMRSGWTEFILNRPMVHDPGTHFQYDSGAVILASAMIKQRYGVHADGFAEEHLLKPLGIKRAKWFRNQEGHPHTGGGLDLRSLDMAKFGLLYLRGGKWEGRQVVPENWVRTSLSRHVKFAEPMGRSVGYGFWWWIFPPDPNGNSQQDVYAALGFMGQHILLVPEHDMVVVVTAGTRGAETREIINFFYDEILPSVVHHQKTNGSSDSTELIETSSKVFQEDSIGAKISKELKEMFDSDQRERKSGKISKANDNTRLDRVKNLVADEQLRSPDDFYHAAMILQHSTQIAGGRDYLLAHVLASSAAARGYEKARWLSAASLDRFLAVNDHPQFFGTQFEQNSSKSWKPGKVDQYLTPILRKAFDIPTEQEQQVRADSFNKQ